MRVSPETRFSGEWNKQTKDSMELGEGELPNNSPLCFVYIMPQNEFCMRQKFKWAVCFLFSLISLKTELTLTSNISSNSTPAISDYLKKNRYIRLSLIKKISWQVSRVSRVRKRWITRVRKWWLTRVRRRWKTRVRRWWKTRCPEKVETRVRRRWITRVRRRWLARVMVTGWRLDD